jgi:predicted DNA-binding protein YlxM (UPF0122 family)
METSTETKQVRLTDMISNTNVFAYAKMNEMVFENIMHQNGQERISTFFSDLSIAEWCENNLKEKDAIQDTYNRVCEHWIEDYKMFTEFVLSLNHKTWMWYNVDDKLCELYRNLYYEAEDKFYAHYENDAKAQNYYFKMTD